MVHFVLNQDNISAYDPVTTGKVIARERRLLKKSQEEFVADYGSHLGISSRQTLAKWESGRGSADFSVYQILELCKIFECDPGYLLGEYSCKRRPITDICEETGLSEALVSALLRRPPTEDELESVPDAAFFESPLSIVINALYETSSFQRLFSALDECLNVGMFPTSEEQQLDDLQDESGISLGKIAKLEALKNTGDIKGAIPIAEILEGLGKWQHYKKRFVEEANKRAVDIAVFNVQRAAADVAEEMIRGNKYGGEYHCRENQEEGGATRAEKE